MLLKIKELRKQKKWTQSDLAAHTGLSARMIFDYEQETKDIPLQKLQLIANALGVSIFEIFNVADKLPVVNDPGENYKQLENLLLIEKDRRISELQKTIEELRNDKALYIKYLDNMDKVVSLLQTKQ